MKSKEFIRYLKEKGCYNSWKKQTLNNIRKKMNEGSHLCKFYHNGNLKKFVNHFIRDKRPHEIIMYSFTWGSSNEGGLFWSKMYTELTEITNGKKSLNDVFSII